MRAHTDPTSLKYTFKQVLMAGPDSPRALMSLAGRCLEPGKYAQHLDRWLVLIIDGEEVKYNPV